MKKKGLGNILVVMLLVILAIAIASSLWGYYQVSIIRSLTGIEKGVSDLSPGALSEECRVLVDNGPDRINVVFFSDGETAQEYIDYFLDFPPINRNRKAFNFYFINSPVDCTIYQGKALFCHSRELIKKAALCPNDIIVVIKEEDRSIRSSAYGRVMSINRAHRLSVFAHEFGHVFSFLAEEYVPAKLPDKAPNCVEKCDDFDGPVDECVEGCSEGNFWRSIPNGIMRSLGAGGFGKFNDILIEERIFDITGLESEEVLDYVGPPIGTGSIIFDLFGDSIYPTTSECKDEEYLLFEGAYPKPGEKAKKIIHSFETGCAGGSGNGGFDFEFLRGVDETISRGQFNARYVFTISDEEGFINGEVYDESDVNFILTMPVNEEEARLVVGDDAKVPGLTVFSIPGKIL